MTWKLTKSSLKPTDKDWSMSWKNGKKEIEIIKNKRNFEVWEQYEYEEGAWDGKHLGTFKNLNNAITFAKKQIK